MHENILRTAKLYAPLFGYSKKSLYLLQFETQILINYHFVMVQNKIMLKIVYVS